jgi:hypothetical protein
MNEVAAKTERNGRLSAEDWAQAALDLIAEQGVASVAVEPLARRLGVSLPATRCSRLRWNAGKRWSRRPSSASSKR